MSLHEDLNAMKAKLEEVERLQKLTRGLARETLDACKLLGAEIAEFHVGCAEMVNKHGPQAGLTDDQIQPLSGGEGGKDDPPQ